VIRTQEDNGIIQFKLIFSNPSVFDLNISVNAISGTATSELCAIQKLTYSFHLLIFKCILTICFAGGVDFTSGPYVVTFPMSRIFMVYNISIDADRILEVDETFKIAIDSASLPFDVFSRAPDEVSLVIVDDDRKLRGKLA